MKATFYLATKPQHFKDCHKLLRSVGREAATQMYTPTIMAFWGQRLVGFVSTADPYKAKVVMIGELAIAPDIKKPGLLMIRLLEIYNAMMYRMGMKVYYSSVPKLPEWEEYMGYMKRLFPISEETPEFVFFRHVTVNDPDLQIGEKEGV